MIVTDKKQFVYNLYTYNILQTTTDASHMECENLISEKN